MLTLERNHSALLVMDFQTSIIGPLGDAGAKAVEEARALVAQARAEKIPVIYVVVGFRPGYPELSSRNLAFTVITSSGRFLAAPGTDIVEPLRPAAEDVVVVKHRVSAFTGTDLDMILRARGIDTLILAGVATGGVVLSTLRHAADADYRLVVAKDACVDRDDEVHRVLTEKLFPRQAAVTSATEICAALAAGS
ncbi:MAG TPA: isochorismatase family cysteine hydrolase [Polyangia bacterium]|jgi:nicotinamidase-related amidase